MGGFYFVASPPPPRMPAPASRPYTLRSADAAAALAQVEAFRQNLTRRRSVRDFSAEPVPRAVIEAIIATAASAPSGAHKQPWTFCAVSDPALKTRIRAAAEAEEYESYTRRMSAEWLEDLQPIGTDHHKPFLEIAPWLIVVFRQVHGVKPDGSRAKHYYVGESVGIAAGFLLAAVHAAGLVALTHTPSPMAFLTELLGRPNNERPYLLIPVGFPAAGARVPDFERKALEEVAVFY